MGKAEGSLIPCSMYPQNQNKSVLTLINLKYQYINITTCLFLVCRQLMCLLFISLIFSKLGLSHRVKSLVLNLYVVHVLQQHAGHSSASHCFLLTHKQIWWKYTLVSVGTWGLAALWVHIIGTVIQPLWTYGRGLSINTLVRWPLCPHDQSWASDVPPPQPSPLCDYDCHLSCVCLEKMTSTPLRCLSGLHVKSGLAFLAAVQVLWNPSCCVFSVISCKEGAEL